MADEQDARKDEEQSGLEEKKSGLLDGKQMSRRQFLKMAGAAGATVALAGGVGGLVAACGDDEDTGTGTDVDVGAESGEEIKAGYVLPVTGAMAAFGAAASWHIDYFNKNVWKDGFVMGDGKKHKFTVIVEDMQSDSTRAAQLAGDLIQNAGVTLIGGSASADNVVPVRDTAEALGCPCITYDCPGDAWNAAQPEGGFKWCWHTWFVFKDIADNFIATWDQIPTNKVVGGLYPNDGDGNAFAGGLPAAFQARGYSYVDPGRYQNNTDDYSAMISQFKSEGVEIVNGVPTPPDFANFWKQSLQMNFHPKISTEAKAMLFPQGVNALGTEGDGQTVECWFHPKYPYTSTLTGLTAQDVCDMWEADKNEQWTQPLCFFGQFEVFTDILKRCTNPSDKLAIIEATKGTNITTIGGPVNWTVNPEPYSGWNNFCTKPVAVGQWVTGKGSYPYDMEIVTSATQTEIKTTAPVKELQY